MPKSSLPVAEAPPRPLERAQRRRKPHLQLVPVGVRHERLACRAARRDAEHVSLLVVVREELEVQFPADRVLLEERQRPEIGYVRMSSGWTPASSNASR